MERLALPIVVLLCIVLVASCSNVKNKKITDENKAIVLEEMKDTKDLTMEEVHLFDGYLLRRGIKEPGGMTVGQMIEEQKKYRQDAKVREAEDKADKEKARTELDQKRKALSDTVTVTALEKTTEKAGFIETTTLKFSCQNHGGRDVRGFKGTVVFSDLFGEKLTEWPLKEEEVLEGR